jgi:hypothetical protein
LSTSETAKVKDAFRQGFNFFECFIHRQSAFFISLFSLIMTNKFFDSFNSTLRCVEQKKPFRLLKFLFLCSNVLIMKLHSHKENSQLFARFVMNDARQLMKEIVEIFLSFSFSRTQIFSHISQCTRL